MWVLDGWDMLVGIIRSNEGVFVCIKQIICEICIFSSDEWQLMMRSRLLNVLSDPKCMIRPYFIIFSLLISSREAKSVSLLATLSEQTNKSSKYDKSRPKPPSEHELKLKLHHILPICPLKTCMLQIDLQQQSIPQNHHALPQKYVIINICIYPPFLLTLRDYYNIMIQEQAPPHPQSNYHFIRGQYASVKIKMQPQSLLVDVPLEWQMDKIKCLLIKIMFKLQFDMFCFHHDGQEIPGDWTLRSVIEQDHDFQCIKGDHYVLTFVKHEVKTQRFEKYYLSKMKPLIKSLEASPFEPILHPAYYSMKYLNHINHIPIEGGRELIVNFNQLQQMQNVINEQRRENQVGPNIGMNLAGNLGQNGGNNGGWLGWLGVGVIRFIQIVSLLTIGQFLYNNSSMNVFIVIALLCITYFAIQVFKKQKNKDPNPAQTKQQNNQVRQSGEEVSLISKLFYRCLIFLTERMCQAVECLLAFLLALFPNWTVQAHKEWFKGTHSTIDLKINQWRLKVGHQGSDQQTNTQQQQQSREQHDETDQDIQIKDSEDMHKLHQE